MANQTIKDIHKSPAQAVIDSEAKDVINYYAEERAALSYAPVMTSDRGSNYPTQLMISADGETWSELPAERTTPVPLPRDLRPTADDWQPSCEVSPSSVGYDLGGFTATNLAPKKISVTWPKPITAYLCRKPYSPLTSWPWRTWWGDSLPLYVEGLAGLPIDEVTVPSEGHALELPTANTMESGWLTPSDLQARGYDVDTSVFSVPCVVPTDWDGSHDMPSDEFTAKMQAKSDAWGCIVAYPFYKYAPAVFAGVYTDGDLRVGAQWNKYAFGAHAHVFCTLPRAWAGETVLIGYREPDTATIKGSQHVLQDVQSHVLAKGVYSHSETVAPVGDGYNVIHWYSFAIPRIHLAAFLIGRYSAGWMRLEQKRNFPVPFAPAFATIRPNWPGALRNNGLGGRLTDMILPACAYDIVLHWWAEDGKSLALPFKEVAVERSAKVVAETKTDVIASDWLTAERAQFTTMRGETETRYRCALDLDEDEAKTAATIAESPFYCYTTADDEVTRHWCELVDVKEEWSNGETAEITITIKGI